MKLIILFVCSLGVMSQLTNGLSSKASDNVDPAPSPIAFASYEEIKDLPNHPEKLLVDVREPNELAETGRIPTSINIPCK